MNSHILVPFDGSTPARHALEHTLEHFPAADVTVLTVIDETGYSSDYFPSAENERVFRVATERLEAATSIAEEYGVSIDCAVEIGPPCPAISEYAEETDVDHVVIGTHGRTGLSRIIVGSVAESVVRQSSAPVTTVK